jgi:hypothetical protein
MPPNEGVSNDLNNLVGEQREKIFELQKIIEGMLSEKEGRSKIINENPDSIEVGTPAKGGAVKIYGDFSNKENFKAKIDAAKEVKEYASLKLILPGA